MSDSSRVHVDPAERRKKKRTAARRKNADVIHSSSLMIPRSMSHRTTSGSSLPSVVVPVVVNNMVLWRWRWDERSGPVNDSGN